MTFKKKRMNKAQKGIKEKFIELTKIGLTDKADYHAYEEVYPFLLYKYLGKECNIAEIGIGHGGGLRILSDLFPESKIYGVDYNLGILKIDTEGTNIEVFQCDQTSAELQTILPELDIVIEDASHQFDKSIKTFELLEPQLKSGAIYIIEDVYPQFVQSYRNDGRFEIYDATEIKGRGDDTLAVYIKK